MYKQTKTAGKESGCVFNYCVEMVVSQFAIFDFTIYVCLNWQKNTYIQCF